MNLGQQWSRAGKWLFSAGGAQTREGPKESIRMEAENVLSIKGFIVQSLATLKIEVFKVLQISATY